MIKLITSLYQFIKNWKHLIKIYENKQPGFTYYN